MLKYIIKRLLNTIPLLIVVSLITFFLIRLSPVDPLADLRLNPSISQKTLDSEVKRLGLDKPIIVQYFLWAKSFIKGDMGYSVTGEKVINQLKQRVPNTLLLSICVILATWLAAIPMGVIQAKWHNSKWDKLFTVISSVGMAVPSFFLALLMLIFAVQTGILPTGGLTSINYNDLSIFGKVIDIAKHLILPVFVLSFVSVAGIQRQMRSNMLEVMNEDYIKFARAKGLDENTIMFKYALRNAINPLITLLGFEFAGLLGGAALTEYIFQYPGLGRLVLDAVMRSDINLVMASLMIGTIMLVLGNLIADILLRLVDPRVRVN